MAEHPFPKLPQIALAELGNQEHGHSLGDVLDDQEHHIEAGGHQHRSLVAFQNALVDTLLDGERPGEARQRRYDSRRCSKRSRAGQLLRLARRSRQEPAGLLRAVLGATVSCVHHGVAAIVSASTSA